MSTPISPPHASSVTPSRLWFGLTAGAIAWVVESFVSVLISSEACKDGNGDWGPLSAPEVRIVLGLISILLLAIAIAGGMVAYRNWRALAEHRSFTQDEAFGREDFMAVAGVFLNSAMGLGIIWAGIPPILMNVCINFR